MSPAPFFLFATSPTPPGLPAPTFSGLLVGILFAMFFVAQFALLGIWLGCHRYAWWDLALGLGLLGALLLLPVCLMGYMVVGLATQSAALALPVVLAPGHLLGSFLGLQLCDLDIAREPNAPARHFQFSMRRMFLLITALAVVLGIGVWASRRVDEIFIILPVAALCVVGPPVLFAPLTVWATWSKHFSHPRLAIVLAVALAMAVSIVSAALFVMIGCEPEASPLLLGGEFSIVAAELLALRAYSSRRSRLEGSASSE